MVAATGSSPRVWGIHEGRCGCRRDSRFIPTRVGNTARRCAWACVNSVHPHACGEYDKWAKRKNEIDGSSPRVWGILCAFAPSRPVHPHACGEYYEVSNFGRVRSGSSPRVWGIPAHTDCKRSNTRFIPTRVGNTFPAEPTNR